MGKTFDILECRAAYLREACTRIPSATVLYRERIESDVGERYREVRMMSAWDQPSGLARCLVAGKSMVLESEPISLDQFVEWGASLDDNHYSRLCRNIERALEGAGAMEYDSFNDERFDLSE